MSILDRVTGSRNDGSQQGASIKPVEVETRLEAAERDLRAIHLKFGPALLALERGERDAQAAIDAITAEITTAEQKIRSLQFMLDEAKRIQAMQEQINRENLYASQRKSADMHFAEARKLAVKFEREIADTIETYAKLKDKLDKARRSSPLQGQSASQAWSFIGALDEHYAPHLMGRLAGAISGDPRSHIALLPAAKPYNAGVPEVSASNQIRADQWQQLWDEQAEKLLTLHRANDPGVSSMTTESEDDVRSNAS